MICWKIYTRGLFTGKFLSRDPGRKAYILCCASLSFSITLKLVKIRFETSKFDEITATHAYIHTQTHSHIFTQTHTNFKIKGQLLTFIQPMRCGTDSE